MRVRLRKLGGLGRRERVLEVEEARDVAGFRKLVAKEIGLDETDCARLRLVHGGKVLHDYDGSLPGLSGEVTLGGSAPVSPFPRF